VSLGYVLSRSSLGGKLPTIHSYLFKVLGFVFGFFFSFPPLPFFSCEIFFLSLSLLLSATCFATFLFRQLEAVIAKMTKENASLL